MSKNPDITQKELVDQIEALMGRVYYRNGYTSDRMDTGTPLDALLRAEDGEPEDHYCAGVVMLRRFLEWVFEGGPNPAIALQRLYVVARAVALDLILNMSGEEIASIFGQGRAAESARIVMLNQKMKAVGFRHTTFRHQKSTTARAKMSHAQRGNHNRRSKAA